MAIAQTNVNWAHTQKNDYSWDQETWGKTKQQKKELSQIFTLRLEV